MIRKAGSPFHSAVTISARDTVSRHSRNAPAQARALIHSGQREALLNLAKLGGGIVERGLDLRFAAPATLLGKEGLGKEMFGDCGITLCRSPNSDDFATCGPVPTIKLCKTRIGLVAVPLIEAVAKELNVDRNRREGVGQPIRGTQMRIRG
ncbi:hypothetical protein [Sphingomonas koreensis]|uniref:hypothetical protein n=1 Tax=Sphingomonas koreensis TaxID=93064 RepID=UPI000F7E807B|nr:hypothetical protein [Sphingomonas koreensis]